MVLNGEATMYDPPTRGERNFNPGNIVRDGKTKWQGMAADQSGDSRFVVFTDPVFGIRAIGKIIRSYANRGVDTIAGIIHSWAPPNENDTGAYVSHVCDQMGCEQDTKLDIMDPDCMERLVRAIIAHENGRVNYDDDVIIKGVDSALA